MLSSTAVGRRVWMRRFEVFSSLNIWGQGLKAASPAALESGPARRSSRSSRSRLRRIAAGLLAVGLAWLAVAPDSLALPAYPPRANCALSATADLRSGTVSIQGSGFAPQRPISLSVSRTHLSSPVTDADGSFSVRQALPSAAALDSTVHAQSPDCMADVVLPASTTPDSPGLPDADAGATASASHPSGQLAATLPTGGLGAQLFLGIIALVIVLAIGFLLIAGRAGRRDS